MSKKKTGRPALVKGQPTVRAGFVLPRHLWLEARACATKKDLLFSELMRLAVTHYLAEDRKRDRERRKAKPSLFSFFQESADG